MQDIRIELEVPYSRLMNIVQRWQQQWEIGCKGRHMYSIQPQVGNVGRHTLVKIEENKGTKAIIKTQDRTYKT